jgi:hypothetical protein
MISGLSTIICCRVNRKRRNKEKGWVEEEEERERKNSIPNKNQKQKLKISLFGTNVPFPKSRPYVSSYKIA